MNDTKIVSRLEHLIKPLPGYHTIDLSTFIRDSKSGKLYSPNPKRDYTFCEGRPTTDDINRHLNGTLALAVRTQFVGALDIDPPDYNSFNAEVWLKLNERIIKDGKFSIGDTKSGGVRLLRWMQERVSESLLLGDLQYWANRLNTDGVGVEFFPDGGRTFTLPYYNNKDSSRMSVELFVATAEELRRIDTDLRYREPEDNFEHGDSREIQKKTESQGDALSFTRLIRIEPKNRAAIDSVRWILEHVSGKQVNIASTEELVSAARVSHACLEQHAFEPNLTVKNWKERRRELLQELVLLETEGEADSDSIWNGIQYFCRQAIEHSWGREMLMYDKGRVYVTGACYEGDESEDEVTAILFAPDQIISQINASKLVKGRVNRADVLDIVRAHGGGSKVVKINRSPSRVYWFPFELLPDEVSEIATKLETGTKVLGDDLTSKGKPFLDRVSNEVGKKPY